MADIKATVKILTTAIKASAEVNPGFTDPYACSVLNSEISQAERQTLQRVASIKTGQTTSFATGDDGDREDGRGVDFFTLDCNNSFGNTNRFTDINGLQVYGDDYVIDHVTGLGWYRLRPFIGTKNWTESMTAVEANTTLGFLDWFMPNINQLLSLINTDADTAGGLNYSPINMLGLTSCFTSSTQKDNTANCIAFFLNRIIGNIVLSAKTTQTNNVIQCRKHF